MILTHCTKQSEVPKLEALRSLFGPDLLVISPFTGVADYLIFDTDKSTTAWTHRWMTLFINSNEDRCTKIDPDTIFTGPTLEHDEAIVGDFRETRLGPIWFGGYQHLTKEAARLILPALEVKKCEYQDIELALAVRKCGISVYNHPDINCWRHRSDPSSSVYHWGRSTIPKKPHGFIAL